MRSHSDDIDLGTICKHFGGGGHKSAAAFAETRLFFNNIVIKSVDLNKYIN